MRFDSNSRESAGAAASRTATARRPGSNVTITIITIVMMMTRTIVTGARAGSRRRGGATKKLETSTAFIVPYGRKATASKAAECRMPPPPSSSSVSVSLLLLSSSSSSSAGLSLLRPRNQGVQLHLSPSSPSPSSPSSRSPSRYFHNLMAQQNDNDDTFKKNQNQTNKNRKKGNFITEWMRTFSASSPNTSGSYNLLINYDELPFPGPEIGKWALEKSPLTAVTTTSPTDPANGDRYGSLMPATSPTMPHLHMMTVAGGCFWGVQLLLDRVPGVEYTLVGYTQGRPTEIRPNYDQVSVAGATSHTEAVLVYYDPAIVSYETLIKDVFLKHIDPTTVNGQGRDYGKQYRTGIYTHTLEQEQTARRIVMEDVAPKLDRPIATELRPATIFWPAEPYHQKYLQSGGRFGIPQSAEKGSNETIRCYG